MFGYVIASWEELTKAQKNRYSGVYCGICRAILRQSGNMARMGLSYDMAFLALLLMSLYEPQEESRRNACLMHPVQRRTWVDSEIIHYCADMNVALSYYNCLDDWQDDGNHPKKWMADHLAQYLHPISQHYPRQVKAIKDCTLQLSALEKENCADADRCANCFGQLMAELLVCEEDLWSNDLREMGMALGRFIYLADAAVDYKKDARKHKYNPYLAMGTGEDFPRWEEYLILAMARCTEYYEKLPLVQDKPLLDNILYSGVWLNLRQQKEAKAHDR